jgi:hypothetical protein
MEKDFKKRVKLVALLYAAWIILVTLSFAFVKYNFNAGQWGESVRFGFVVLMFCPIAFVPVALSDFF